MQKEQKMDHWEKKKIAAICAIMLICLGVSLWRTQPAALEPATTPAQALLKEEPLKAAAVTVHISGAVAKPGVYQVPPNCRIQEALPYAGGLTAEANEDKVNLAKKCKDGMQINVPYKKAANNAGNRTTIRCSLPSSSVVKPNRPTAEDNIVAPAAGKVNLNTADAKTLVALPGIGEATAAKIIAHRQKKPFATIEEIQDVPGIGPAKFKALANRLEV